MSNNLGTSVAQAISKRYEIRIRPTVADPNMMAQVQLWTQGQMSQRGVEN
jgi:hypothetical protein